MSLRSSIRISIESIMSKGNRFILWILLVGLSLFSIGYYSLFSGKSKVIEDECDALLAKGIDGTGLMRVYDYGKYEANELKKDALAFGKVKSIGSWTLGSLHWQSELSSIQHSFSDIKQQGNASKNDALVCCLIDRTALEINRLHLAKEAEISQEKRRNPNWHGIYLGANFKGITLGQVFEHRINDDFVEEYEVIGILEKGQYIVGDDVIALGEGNGVYSTLCLDSLVVIIMEMGISEMHRGTAWAYIPADGVSLSEAGEYLSEKAKELELKIDFAFLSDGFRMQKVLNQDITGIEKELCYTLMVICLLIISCIMIMQVVSEKQIIGIYYSCGFSSKDIMLIYVFQNLLKIVIATVTSFCALKYYCHHIFSNISPFRISIFRWLNQIALPHMLICAVTMFCIFSLIPVCIVMGKKPAEMIKDYRG
ncbi:MAG: ABC transporter permease [Lachnospiraceae bacterium]|nr:ABC transporter permease [Lachnospiraceae bacterium]